MIACILLLAVCMSGCTAGDGRDMAPVAFTLSKTALELSAGTQAELTAETDGKRIDSKDLWWVTSDENIVTVDDGKLQARAEGQAVIAVSNRTGYMVLCRVSVF